MFRILLILMILLGGLVVPVAYPQPVYAAIQTLTLTGEGDLTGGQYSGGGSASDYTDLNSDDGDTSRLQTIYGTALFSHCFTVQVYAGLGPIDSVTIYYKARYWSSPAGGVPFIRISGSNHDGGADIFTGAYVLYSHTWATNPTTGLPWTAAGINAAQFGIKVSSSSATQGLVTYMYVEVDYPESPPIVTTDGVSGVSGNSTHCWAVLNGDITDTGGDNVTCRGFVWDTASHDPLASDNVTPPNGYSDNISFYTAGGQDWGTGTFTYTANLSCCDTYYYRSFAGNSIGWDYGEEETFRTMCDPDIDTQAASYIEATTARLQSLIISDGEQACDVRFAYGTTSGNCTDDALGCPTASCNTSSYDTTTAWVGGYITGQTPYVNLTGLTDGGAGTTYYFCTQIRNDVSCRCGGELSFTTESGINEPTDFQGIPTPTEISLAWVKSPGSTNVLIRYKLGDYPNSLADGILVYFDTMNSVVHDSESSMALELHDGLTPGTTYFYRAWGESGGIYSGDNVTLMITTLAIGPGGDTFPTPETPSQWFQAPDHTSMRYMPFYPIVNFFADSFEIPYATIWYMLALAFCAGGGIAFYGFFGRNNNLFLSIIVVGVLIMLMSFLKLLPMWHIIVYGVFAGVGIFVGERR